MDAFPIYYGESPIAIGVEIRYEKFDAEHLMHMLGFLEDYRKRFKGKIALIPAINVIGVKSSVTKIKKSFEKYPEGERNVNGYVSLYFLDEMRPLFEEYHALLRQIKAYVEATTVWDEDHQFFHLLNCFDEIASTFFPQKTGMH